MPYPPSVRTVRQPLGERVATARASILLVHSRPGLARLVLRDLREQKIWNRPRVFAGGSGALAFLREAVRDPAGWRPDLVLMDLHLREMTAPALLAEMERDEALRAIPVVVLAASPEEAEICRTTSGLRAAACSSLPLDFNDLAAIVGGIADLGLAIVRGPGEIEPPSPAAVKPPGTP
jgi:CheY-like chemotaxis protein